MIDDTNKKNLLDKYHIELFRENGDQKIEMIKFYFGRRKSQKLTKMTSVTRQLTAKR